MEEGSIENNLGVYCGCAVQSNTYLDTWLESGQLDTWSTSGFFRGASWPESLEASMP